MTCSASANSCSEAYASGHYYYEDDIVTMRIAYFTSLNPQPGGISDHSEELLPHLAPLADIDIVVADGYTPTHPEICERFRILKAGEYLRDPRAYERCRISGRK